MLICRRTITLVLAALIAAPWSLARGEGDPGEPRTPLREIRERIRQEAGVAGQWDSESGVVWRYDDPELADRGDDLPMIAVTVLPGDTHLILSKELTGSPDAVSMIRAIAPTLKPGEKIQLPRNLLSPDLSDEARTSFAIDTEFPTLGALVREKIDPPENMVWVSSRVLMRLNGITDASKITKGQLIEIPTAMIAGEEDGDEDGAEDTVLVIRDDYLYKNLQTDPRTLKPEKKSLKKKTAKKSVRKSKVARLKRSVGLVVFHTTEHSGGDFANVAAYIKKNKLANYIIGPNGEVFRVVPEEYVSNGCGESLWNGVWGTDKEAINIEIYADTAPGPKYSGISDAQYAGLKKLIADIGKRRPNIHSGRFVTHSMVSVSYKYKTRSRKGDPHEFDWAKAGLPDNSVLIDQDVLLKRVSLCRDKRYADRVTPGQTAADQLLRTNQVQEARAQ